MAVQVVRLVAVLSLLGVAAVVATPKGRLPLAFRGMMAILKRDGTVRTSGTVRTESVSGGKRLLAFALVLLAALLAVI